MKEYLLHPSLVDLPLFLLMYTIKLIVVANTIIASNASMTILTVTGSTIIDEEFCGEDAVVLLKLLVLELVVLILVAILVVKLAVGLIIALKLVIEVAGMVFVELDLVEGDSVNLVIILVVLVVLYFSKLEVDKILFWVVHKNLSVNIKRSNIKIIVVKESRYFCL